MNSSLEIGGITSCHCESMGKCVSREMLRRGQEIIVAVLFRIFLVRDGAGSPGTVHQLPLPIELNRVPDVRDILVFQVRTSDVTVAFGPTGDLDDFQPRLLAELFKQVRVTLAMRDPLFQDIIGRHFVGQRAGHIVGDSVRDPAVDEPGLFPIILRIFHRAAPPASRPTPRTLD